MTEDLVLGGLRRAIRERQPDAGLIHYTDRGDISQFLVCVNRLFPRSPADKGYRAWNDRAEIGLG